MNKLKLDDLAVEEFPMGDVPDLRGGTVQGYDVTEMFCNISDDDYTCRVACAPTAYPLRTCYYTCVDRTCTIRDCPSNLNHSDGDTGGCL